MEGEKKILGVQYLRGLAALGVVCCHYSPGQLSVPILSSIFSFGQAGVFVFFFISGFIIIYSLMKANYKPSQFFTFLLKRSIRIDPTYYAVIILTISLFNILHTIPSFKGSGIALIPRQILAHVFYVIPFTKYPFYNHVFWTLCVEFQFYLLIGIFYFISNSFVYRYAFLILFTLTSWWPISNSYYVVFTYAPIFGAGISFIDYYKNRKPQNLALPILLLITIFYKFGLPIASLIFLSGCVILYVDVIIKQLSFLGDISYSLYLTHSLVLIVLTGALKRMDINTRNHPLLWMVTELATAVVIGFLTYIFIERPSIGLSKKFFYNPSKVI